MMWHPQSFFLMRDGSVEWLQMDIYSAIDWGGFGINLEDYFYSWGGPLPLLPPAPMWVEDGLSGQQSVLGLPTAVSGITSPIFNLIYLPVEDGLRTCTER